MTICQTAPHWPNAEAQFPLYLIFKVPWPEMGLWIPGDEVAHSGHWPDLQFWREGCEHYIIPKMCQHEFWWHTLKMWKIWLHKHIFRHEAHSAKCGNWQPVQQTVHQHCPLCASVFSYMYPKTVQMHNLYSVRFTFIQNRNEGDSEWRFPPVQIRPAFCNAGRPGCVSVSQSVSQCVSKHFRQ